MHIGHAQGRLQLHLGKMKLTNMTLHEQSGLHPNICTLGQRHPLSAKSRKGIRLGRSCHDDTIVDGT